MKRVRIGILGAARIAPSAVIRPSRVVPEAQVVAIGSRDIGRARAMAAKYGIPRSYGSYAEVIRDPEVDAVYVALPNGLHGHWVLDAISCSKHVLCEKPFAANAQEAEVVARAAQGSGLVVMEGFHYRFHPLFERIIQILETGEIGEVEHISASMCFLLPTMKDIRWQLRLAGGAMMDAGCYTVHMVRHIARAEPSVSSASAQVLASRPQIDRAMQAELSFDDGRSASVKCSMLSRRLLDLSLTVRGAEGMLTVFNPTRPQLYHRMVLHSPKGRRVEHAMKEPTFDFQLRAFVGAILRGDPVPTGPSDAQANMSVIDACYRAAGLEPRSPTPVD